MSYFYCVAAYRIGEKDRPRLVAQQVEADTAENAREKLEAMVPTDYEVYDTVVLEMPGAIVGGRISSSGPGDTPPSKHPWRN